jgi:hypothetical protein
MVILLMVEGFLFINKVDAFDSCFERCISFFIFICGTGVVADEYVFNHSRQY